MDVRRRGSGRERRGSWEEERGRRERKETGYMHPPMDVIPLLSYVFRWP